MPNGMPMIVTQLSAPASTYPIAIHQPTSTTQKMFISVESKLRSYTTVLPNGVSVSSAILNAWTPNGMPMIVMHSSKPTSAHPIAIANPPRTSHRILPKSLMPPSWHGWGRQTPPERH